jgi:hypothetical protein
MRTTTSLLLGVGLAIGGWRAGQIAGRNLRPAVLLDLATEAAPVAAASGLTFVFLFRPDECPRLMAVLDLLNEIAPADGRVVGGLTVEAYRFPAWRELVRAEAIEFPVMRLHPLRVRAALAPLGYDGGPLLLVFDGAGRVLHVTDALDRRNLSALLAEVIRAHRPARPGGRLAGP